MSHLFVFWLVESSIVCYFISDKQRCATPIRSLDDDCSAGRSYRRAWRASNRRPHTHATSIFSLSYNPSFPSMKYVAEKVLERALTFASFFYILGHLSRSPTKLSSRFAIHALAIEQSARPGGPNAEADLCAIKTNIQNPLDNFILKRGSRATGKPEFYFMQRKHLWAAFLRECARVLPWANSMIFQKVGFKIITSPLSLRS